MQVYLKLCVLLMYFFVLYEIQMPYILKPLIHAYSSPPTLQETIG